MRLFRIGLATILSVTVCSLALGANLEIVKSSNEKIPVDISGISRGTSVNRGVFIKTLQSDLKRSGWFTISPPGRGVVELKALFAESGQYSTLKAEVLNRATGRKYFSRSYNERAGNARGMAHKFADDIVKAVKDVEGIASTRIVMIGSRDGKKDIYACDYDGGNLLRITKEGAVCLTPAWGPDAKTILYTSYYQGFPDVYKIDLATNFRKRVSQYPGINVGATVSSDGKSMAIILSKDGNPDVYVKDLRSQRLTRVTKSQHAAEASPSWSPDGQRIVFVSNKTRRPHLYVASRTGGAEKKITFTGNENVGPDWGPSGRIVYSSRRNGKYQVCITNPDTGETLQLTTDHADYEDPSWAPDGRHIVCSRIVGYKSELYVLDTLGDPPVRLLHHDGDWYAPAWSHK